MAALVAGRVTTVSVVIAPLRDTAAKGIGTITVREWSKRKHGQGAHA